MAIAFRDVATDTKAFNIGAATVTIPAAVQADDLLVIFLNTGNTDINTPSGWTLQSGYPKGPATGSPTVQRVYVFRRIAQVGDAGTTVSLTHTSGTYQRSCTTLLAYSGVDTTTPIHLEGSTTSASGNATITAPSITTTRDGCQIVRCFNGGDATMSSVPATQRSSLNNSGATCQGTSDTAQGSQGSTGTASATQGSAASWIGLTFAVAPTAAVLDLAMAGLASSSGSLALDVVGPVEIALAGLAASSGSFDMQVSHDIALSGPASSSGSFAMVVPPIALTAGLGTVTIG